MTPIKDDLVVAINNQDYDQKVSQFLDIIVSKINTPSPEEKVDKIVKEYVDFFFNEQIDPDEFYQAFTWSCLTNVMDHPTSMKKTLKAILEVIPLRRVLVERYSPLKVTLNPRYAPVESSYQCTKHWCLIDEKDGKDFDSSKRGSPILIGSMSII